MIGLIFKIILFFVLMITLSLLINMLGITK
jgi:hypothetical protein